MSTHDRALPYRREKWPEAQAVVCDEGVCRSEFVGNIASVRAVEDAIRATRRYLETFQTMSNIHPSQADWPSRKFTKHYEVYPDTDLSWDMPLGKALAWVAGADVVRMAFRYDYRLNVAVVEVNGGPEVVKKLAAKVPGFSEGVAKVIVAGGERVTNGRP